MKRLRLWCSLSCLLFLPLALIHAKNLWEVLVQSPGGIESAAITPAGDVCVLEQLRFHQQFAGADHVISKDLPLNERIFLSPGGSYYASIVYEGEKDNASAARVTVCAGNGQALWAISPLALNDIIPLESGGAVGVNRNLNLRENEVYFFTPTGKLARQLTVKAPGEIKVSPANHHVLINSGIEGALLFDDTGRELARLGLAYRLAFSPDGRWIALLYGPKLSIYYDGQQTFIGDLGGEIVRGAAFSADHRTMAAFTDHTLYLLDNPGGRIILQRELDPAEQLSFTSVDLNRDASRIAVGLERDLGESVKGPPRHPDGLIRLYDHEGMIRFESSITYSHWNTTTPRVKFSPDERWLLVLTRDEVRRAALDNLCGKDGE